MVAIPVCSKEAKIREAEQEVIKAAKYLMDFYRNEWPRYNVEKRLAKAIDRLIKLEGK